MGEIAEGIRGHAAGEGGAGDRRRAWGTTLAAFAALVASASALEMVALVRLGPGPPIVAACGYVAAVTLPLCAVDLRERRLPNPLVMPGFAFSGAGLAWQGLARGSPPWGALWWCVATMVVFGVLAAFGGVGMGDVKLTGMLALALGACGLGVEAIALAVGTAFVAAGAVALGGVVARRALVAGRRLVPWRALVARRGVQGVRSRATPRGEIPFGPFLLAGFWVAVAVG